MLQYQITADWLAYAANCVIAVLALGFATMLLVRLAKRFGSAPLTWSVAVSGLVLSLAVPLGMIGSSERSLALLAVSDWQPLPVVFAARPFPSVEDGLRPGMPNELLPNEHLPGASWGMVDGERFLSSDYTLGEWLAFLDSVEFAGDETNGELPASSGFSANRAAPIDATNPLPLPLRPSASRLGASRLGARWNWLPTAAGLLFLVWCGGVLWQTSVWLRDFYRVQTLRRRASASNDPCLQAAVQAALAKLVARPSLLAHKDLGGRLQLAESDRVAAPITMGIFRPVIIVPRGMASHLSEPELLSVMLHECAHVLRRDALTAVLQRWCSVIYWWNPFIYRINNAIAVEREQICDDRAANAIGCGGLLAEAIVKVAEWRTQLVPQTSLGLSLLDSQDNLYERIDRLTDEDRTMVTRLNSGSFLFLACSIVLLGGMLYTPLLQAQRKVAESPDPLLPESGESVQNEPVAPIDQPRLPIADENPPKKKSAAKSKKAQAAKGSEFPLDELLAPGPKKPGKGEVRQISVFYLRYVASNEAARLINDLLADELKKSGGRCVSNERTNAVIVNAPKDDLKVIEKLLEQLDSNKPGVVSQGRRVLDIVGLGKVVVQQRAGKDGVIDRAVELLEPSTKKPMLQDRGTRTGRPLGLPGPPHIPYATKERKPVVDESVIDRPAVDKPVVDKPVFDERIADEPHAGKRSKNRRFPLDKPMIIDRPISKYPKKNQPAKDDLLPPGESTIPGSRNSSTPATNRTGPLATSNRGFIPSRTRVADSLNSTPSAAPSARGPSNDLAAQIELADRITEAAFAIEQNKSKLQTAKRLASNSAISRDEIRRVEYDYAKAVVRYDLLRSVLELTINGAERDLAFAQTQLEAAEAKHKAGAGPINEVTSAKRSAAQAETTLQILKRIHQSSSKATSSSSKR